MFDKDSIEIVSFDSLAEVDPKELPNTIQQPNEEDNQEKPEASKEVPQKGIISFDDILNEGKEEGDEEEVEENEEKEETPVSKIPSAKKEEIKNSVNYTEIAKYLIEEKTFDDIKLELNDGRQVNLSELPEDVEIDAETFADLYKQQFELKAEKELQKKEEALGEQEKNLYKYFKDGGNIENLLEIYREQRNINDIDITSEDGAIEIITAHLELSGLPEKSIKKVITGLQDAGVEELLETAKDSKDKLLETLAEQEAEKLKEQERINKANRLAQEKFDKEIRLALHSDAIPKREKSDIEDFLFNYKPNPEIGQNTTGFYDRFVEIQRDPKKWYKLVKFVKDFDKFEEKTKVEKETKAKVFKFIHSSQGDVSKNSASALTEAGSPNKGGLSKIKKIIQNI